MEAVGTRHRRVGRSNRRKEAEQRACCIQEHPTHSCDGHENRSTEEQEHRRTGEQKNRRTEQTAGEERETKPRKPSRPPFAPTLSACFDVERRVPASDLPMGVFATQGFAGYAVEFSPFEETRLACASSQHFGIIGNGRLFILRIDGAGRPVLERAFDTKDGLYDCSWSEAHESRIVSASGDGSVKLWDLKGSEGPLRSYHEHVHEVYGVDWNLVRKDTFLSASWDDTIRLWHPDHASSLRTFAEHKYCVYGAVWSPHNAEMFASVSGDYTLKIWNTQMNRSVQTIRAHDYEILSCDWSKYNDYILATGSVDRTIKVWDIRNPRRELLRLRGHQYAVRRLKWSPHNDQILASCSYDMTLMVWNIKENTVVEKCDHHSEFVVGLDFNIFVEGQLASCAWDEKVCVWKIGSHP